MIKSIYSQISSYPLPMGDNHPFKYMICPSIQPTIPNDDGSGSITSSRQGKGPCFSSH